MSDMIEIHSSVPVPAYLAQPAGTPKGAVIVIHEVWGLNAHISSIADRFADKGYIALAPDLLSVANLHTKQIAGLQEALFDPKRRHEVQPILREFMAPVQSPAFAEQTMEHLHHCFDYLYNHPGANQSVAVVGFCFGGTYSFSLATAEPMLKAAIAFYGHADLREDQLKKIRCPIVAFYGEQDERLVSQLPQLTAAMQAAGVDFQPIVYPNCGHAFFNDTNSFSYNAAAAADAWERTLRRLDSALSTDSFDKKLSR